MSFTGLGSRRESPCLGGYTQPVSFPNAGFAAKSPAYMRDVGEEPYFWAQNDEVCVHWAYPFLATPIETQGREPSRMGAQRWYKEDLRSLLHLRNLRQ